MTVGLNFALKRLLKKNVFCISPQRINLCGNVNMLVFDKTGTLTEDNLSVSCAGVPEGPSLRVLGSSQDLAMTPLPSMVQLQQTLASCHSIREIDGKTVGDPLETEMLKFSEWVIFTVYIDMH